MSNFYFFGRRNRVPVLLIAGTRQTHGNYFRFFEALSCRTAELSLPEQRHYRSLRSLTETDYDMLILPGGGDFSPLLYSDVCHGAYRSHSPKEEALDMLQTALLADALAKKKAVLGICKGMQLLNVCFGGSLRQELSADLHPFDGQDRLHSVKTVFPSACGNVPTLTPCARRRRAICLALSSVSAVNSAHHQGIDRLAEDFITLQYAPDGLPETILHQTLPLIGFQWHPERFSALPERLIPTILRCLIR